MRSQCRPEPKIVRQFFGVRALHACSHPSGWMIHSPARGATVRVQRPPKAWDKVYALAKHQEYARVFDWTIDRVEVITPVQRRRRWLAEEKAAIVQETYAPGVSVSLVACRHGIAPNQLFRWRRLYAEGALSPVGAGENWYRPRVPRLAESGARAAMTARRKDSGKRDPTRGAGSGPAKNGCCAHPRPRGTTRREDGCLGHVAPKYPPNLYTTTLRTELLRTGGSPNSPATGNAYSRSLLESISADGGFELENPREHWMDAILECNARFMGRCRPYTNP